MGEFDTLELRSGWLSDDEIEAVRDRVPMVYVDAVPVRVDHVGRITRVGLLLRAMPDGSVSRAVVTGRVLYGETVRDALWRHLTKDLGPDCEPALPPAVAPFTVAEYFPDPGRTGFHDPRQHAVSLAFVVPCSGECEPSQDALDFSWLTLEEVTDPFIADEMTGGHDRLIRMALAHAGVLP